MQNYEYAPHPGRIISRRYFRFHSKNVKILLFKKGKSRMAFKPYGKAAKHVSQEDIYIDQRTVLRYMFVSSPSHSYRSGTDIGGGCG